MNFKSWLSFLVEKSCRESDMSSMIAIKEGFILIGMCKVLSPGNAAIIPGSCFMHGMHPKFFFSDE